MKLKAEVIGHLDDGRSRLAVYTQDPRNKGICEEFLTREWSFDMNKDVFLSLGNNSPRLLPRPNIGETLTVDVTEDGVLLAVLGDQTTYGLDWWRHPDYARLTQS